jgi:glutamate synthase (NADPH/NADH) small chain
VLSKGLTVRTPTPIKNKVKIPRQHAIEQPPDERRRNFREVSLGFTEELAFVEADRCIECKKPVCIDNCPVEVDIPAFIRLILQENYRGAVEKIREANYLPIICGRVCPQENQCELTCLLGKRYEPIAIGKLERFVADLELEHGWFEVPRIDQRREEKVAIVGSGPAGMTCAAELAKLGYRVTLFEALHAIGGVLQYGIPEFRLPKALLDVERQRLEAMGVEIQTNFIVGRTATVDEIMGEMGYKAVFLATGAGTPNFMGIPGENLNGVYSASEFLTRVNFMKGYRFPEFDTPVKIGKGVAVIGGGDTAMDGARTAIRLGPEKVYLVYRRSFDEMPARKEEVQHAKEEGVEFHVLTAPVHILGNSSGWVNEMICQRMALGEPDENGRKRPVPIEGSEFFLEVDTVIVAIGQEPNPILQKTTSGLSVSKWGTVVVDDSGKTSRPGVYAGGDLSRGGATVILAMRDGKKAAEAINLYLNAQRRNNHEGEGHEPRG